MADDNGLGRLRIVIGYTVVTVWALTFAAALVRPSIDSSLLLSVQALMAIIAGSLYAERYIKRNGGGTRGE